MLSADENQNTCQQRQNSSDDGGDGEMNESHDSDKNEIDRQQEHPDISCDHEDVSLAKSHGIARLKLFVGENEKIQDLIFSSLLFWRDAAVLECLRILGDTLFPINKREFHCVFDGTRIASLMPWTNFLSAGAIVARAPRNFTRSVSTK